MHPTTEAMLQAISEANDSNDFTPAQCWAHIGPAVYEWRHAGKPDLPQPRAPKPELPPGWQWEGHPYKSDQSPEGCWAYKGEDPYNSPWADIACHYGLVGGEPLGTIETNRSDPVDIVLQGIATVEPLIPETP